MPLDIFIFKTSIEEEHLESIAKLLGSYPAIQHWTVDTDDCDKVLRTESSHIVATDIISLIQNAGYTCEELI